MNFFLAILALFASTLLAIPASHLAATGPSHNDFAVLNISNAEAIPPTSFMTNSIQAPNYAHGYCSFHMQLLQQCLYTPDTDWHTEILGNLFSIEDNNRATAVRYPSGAGRIDGGHIKRLTGMGDDGLSLAYWSDDKVYFRFDGGLWDTGTQDDGKAYGLCSWGEWTRGEIECAEESRREVRISDMTCVFKC